MPSKTKPKELSNIDNKIIHITILKEDRQEILSALGLTEDPAERKIAVIASLENCLSKSFNLLRRLPDKPMPAHIKAALEEIAPLAKELAEKMQSVAGAPEVQRFIPNADPGQLWQSLTYLSVESELAIKTITESNQRSDGGARNRRKHEVKETFDIMLTDFFHEYKNPQLIDASIEADCLQSFLEHCKDYLYSK